MDSLPTELIVTILKYCSDRLKAYFLKVCYKNFCYRFFFVIISISKSSYPNVMTLQYIENHQNVLRNVSGIRTIVYTEYLPKNIIIKTLKFNESSTIINHYPKGLTGLIFNNNYDIYDLSLIPKTVKKICIRHMDHEYIKYFLRNIDTELETLVIDNYKNQYLIEWNDDRRYPKLKKLIMRGVSFIFVNGWPKTLKYLNIVESTNKKSSYQTFPPNLKKLSCHNFETLFPNTKIHDTNLYSLRTSCCTEKLPKFLVKLIHNDNISINLLSNCAGGTTTIKILKIGICDLNKSNVDTLVNLKKLIIDEICCGKEYHRYYRRDIFFEHVMNRVPIIVVINTQRFCTYPLFTEIDKLVFSIQNPVQSCVTYIKWIAKSIKVLEINIKMNDKYLTLPNSVVKLTIDVNSELCHTVRLPNSLKSLKVMHNELLTLENLPRKLLKLDYSSGVKVDIPSKIIIF